MPAAGTMEHFPVTACLVKASAHRADLAGICRLYLHKRKAMPGQFFHQLLRKLSPGKVREHPVYPAAFVKFFDIQQFHRCEYRFIPIQAFYVSIYGIAYSILYKLVVMPFPPVRCVCLPDVFFQMVYPFPQVKDDLFRQYPLMLL